MLLIYIYFTINLLIRFLFESFCLPCYCEKRKFFQTLHLFNSNLFMIKDKVEYYMKYECSIRKKNYNKFKKNTLKMIVFKVSSNK